MKAAAAAGLQLELLRSNWGENIIGEVGISAGVATIAVPLILVTAFLVSAAVSTHAVGSIVLTGALFVITLLLIGLVSTTLHTIYTAALYRYATGSKDNAGIAGDLLAAAYRPK
jgi:hypothetical protein